MKSASLALVLCLAACSSGNGEQPYDGPYWLGRYYGYIGPDW